MAIVQVFNGNLVMAAYLVGLAAILDFFDGFTARLLKVSSAIGKDLDSLADMVTFGVVPGLVMFKLIHISELHYFAAVKTQANNGIGDFFAASTFSSSLSYIAFLLPVFSAIRLAKFNHDTRQSDSFIGLPTPANAIFICSLPLIMNITKGYIDEEANVKLADYLIQTNVLIVLTVMLSVLLVAEIPLIALKFKNFGWKGNEIRYVFLGLSSILLIAFQFLGIPIIIIFYLLISVVNNMMKN